MRSFVGVIGLVLAGCGERSPTPAVEQRPPAPAFALIRQIPTPDRVELQALGGGVLELRDGCLRIGPADNSRLVLWPADAEQTPDGMFDPNTGSSVRVGEAIVIGGGEIDGINPANLADPVPQACVGPYWLGARGFFVAPKEEWSAVRIAEKFSISAPQAMHPPAHPESLPATLSGDGITLTVSEGANVCGGPVADPQSRHWTFNVYSDLRMARVLRQKAGGDSERIEAVFNGIDGPRGLTPPQGEVCLRIAAQCETARACDLARSMLSTIRFGDLGKPD